MLLQFIYCKQNVLTMHIFGTLKNYMSQNLIKYKKVSPRRILGDFGYIILQKNFLSNDTKISFLQIFSRVAHVLS